MNPVAEMPYRWTETTHGRKLDLWPQQSMTAQGFAWFIGTSAAFLALPLLAVLGSPMVWILLAFMLVAVGGVWKALMANRADRQIHEELTLSPDRVHLEHRVPKRPARTWDATPNGVTVHLSSDGPVEDYLTLRGGGREVELGAFLTPAERKDLHAELQRLIRA